MFAVEVRSVLEESRRLGFLGDREISEVVEHARSFVGALAGVSGTVLDLGAGGGIPGLVIAHDRPDLGVVLIDRRSKRTDFLDRMVRRLGWSERVSVVCADVEDYAAEAPPFEAAVARGFGPPVHTLSLAARLVRTGGTVVISEPPDAQRWRDADLHDLGVRRLDDGTGAVAVFVTVSR